MPPVARPLTVALLACLPLLACKREAPAPDTAPAADAATPGASAPARQGVAPAAPAATDAVVPPADTTYAQAGVQPPDSGIDTKAIAGTFKGTAPCADCPGIDTTLVLATDGSYTSTDTYRDRGTSHEERGTWSADAGRILLSPADDKSHARSLEPVGADALRPLGADGKPIDAPIDMTLHRGR